MRYKTKLKTGKPRIKSKSQYKVNNWSDYNQSLKKRGMLSLYFPKGDIRAQFINDNPYVKGESGRSSTYQTPYIHLIYTLYRLFGWGQRQMTGYFEDLWNNQKLDIAVPSFGHLCDLFGQIPVEVQQFCDKLHRRIKNGDAISLIVDSTGLSFSKASNWYETKYDKSCNIKPWKKMHISIDLDYNMHSAIITDCYSADIDNLSKLIPKGIVIDKLLADGGYYSINNVETLSKSGIIPVIPPPSHSVIHSKDNTSWHDKIVQYIQDKGSVYAFHKKYGYGKRELIEAQFSRIKRCIGCRLLTQKAESQKTEGIIIANIINLWNSFGKAVSVKIG